MNLTKKSVPHLKVVKLVHRNLQSTNTAGRINNFQFVDIDSLNRFVEFL